MSTFHIYIFCSNRIKSHSIPYRHSIEQSPHSNLSAAWLPTSIYEAHHPPSKSYQPFHPVNPVKSIFVHKITERDLNLPTFLPRTWLLSLPPTPPARLQQRQSIWPVAIASSSLLALPLVSRPTIAATCSRCRPSRFPSWESVVRDLQTTWRLTMLALAQTTAS